MTFQLNIIDIPKHFENSEFYKNINKTEKTIEIPNDKFKQDFVINNFKDFEHLLETLKFWGFENYVFTLEFYIWIFENKQYVIEKLIEKNMNLIKCFEFLFDKEIDYKKLTNELNYDDNILSLNYISIHNKKNKIFETIKIFLTNIGIEYFAFIIKYSIIDLYTTLNLFLIPNFHSKLIIGKYIEKNIDIENFIIRMIIYFNNVECFKKFEKSKNLFELDKFYSSAARFNRLNIIKYMNEELQIKKPHFNRHRIHDNVKMWKDSLSIAAKHGNYECFEYLINNGHQFDSFTSICVAYGNSVDCLKKLIEYGHPLYNYVTFYAIINDSVKTLEYLYERHYEVIVESYKYAFKFFSINCLKFLFEKITPVSNISLVNYDEESYKINGIATLEYLIEKNCTINNYAIDIITYVVIFCDLKYLKNNCSVKKFISLHVFNNYPTFIIEMLNNVDCDNCLNYLLENDYEISFDIGVITNHKCRFEQINNHLNLELLKSLIERNVFKIKIENILD